MASEHVTRAYDEELRRLNNTVAEMGGLAESQLGTAIEAVMTRDTELAARVVEADVKVDQLERELDNLAIRLLALRQPVARDLREIFSALKIASDLEQIGDYAANVAKRSIALSQTPAVRPVYALPRMAHLAQIQIKDVLDSYRNATPTRHIPSGSATPSSTKCIESVPRTAHLHDGGSAQHRLVYSPAFHGEEHRENRRPCNQYCGKLILLGEWNSLGGGAPEGRHVEPRGRDAGSRPAMNKPLVLIVEDEVPLVTMLRYNLEKEGFLVCEAGDGEEALVQIAERKPDLVLLDWMLPLVSGIEVCRRIRRSPETRSLPVIILTARGEETDRVRGLDSGADDYVVKPFSPGELVARLRAVMRRTQPGGTQNVLQFADVELDTAAHRVSRAGKSIHLGPTEFRLLRYLITHPGRVFSREQLLDAVWGHDVYVEARTVDVHIRRLRKALNVDDAVDVVRTVRSAGYALDRSVQR